MGGRIGRGGQVEGGVRVDVNGEVKFCEIYFYGGLGPGGSGLGVRVDVNEELKFL